MSGIAITFPSSPSEGQSYLAQNGFTYIYDSQKNRWKRGGEFVRAPKVLSYAGVAVTTTGSGITTGPNGALIYNVPGFLIPSSDVGVDSYKAYRYAESYPNYTEIQVSISSAFSSIAYAATSTSTTFSIPAGSLSGDTTYYLRARQFVGSDASAAGVGAISGYSPNIVSFATTSTFIDSPTIVSISGSTDFPVYQIGYASTTLPATVTYNGSGVGNLEQVDWRVTGPRIPTSTGDTALAEIGIGTHSSATLANALVLALPFSGATGVGITDDVNNAIRTASGASAGTTKTLTIVGTASTISIAGLALTSHFYDCAVYFDTDASGVYTNTSSDFTMGTGDFTIEFWFYSLLNSATTPAGYHRRIIAIGDNDATDAIQIVHQINSPYISYTSDAVTFYTGRTNIMNAWHHIAVSRRSGLVNLFVDGNLEKSFSDTNNKTVNQVHIGIYPDLVSGSPRGYLQDLKIYKGLAKYQENFTPPLPTYGTISYTTGITNVGVATTAFFESTGDIPTAEASSTAANALVLAMPMNRTFGFQDINVAVRGLTSGASAGTAKTVGLGTTSTANAPTHPIISSTESKWYDGAAYFDKSKSQYCTSTSSDYAIGSNDVTIECWINSTDVSTTSSGSHIFQVDGAATNILLAIGDSGNGDVRFLIRNDSGTNLLNINAPANTLTTNTWYHLAGTLSGTSGRLFVNGNLVASGTLSGTRTHTGTNAYFGTNAGSRYYGGYIQDLKFYKGLAKYTANFTPPQPICGFSADISTQTGFTTTTASGALLSSVVGLGSTSILAFDAGTTYAGITSITSSSGITTLTDPYAQNLVLALPLADITGAGTSFTNDRNTQIRSVSLVGGGTTKTITNTNVSLATTSKWYGNVASFNGSSYLSTPDSTDFTLGSGDWCVEFWVNFISTSNQFLYGQSNSSGSTATINIYGALASNKLKVQYSSGGGETGVTGATTISSGTWYHYAAVRSGSTISLFVNGIREATSNYTGSIADSANQFAIGRLGEYAAEPANAYIQDFKFYKGVAKYTTNFTPPPPMFGDYTRSTPNKVVFTPGSDYVLEAKNTSGEFASSYSATRQWGTKPEGGIYDPYAGNLVLAVPFNNTTSVFDVTGQIKFETPTSTYSSGQTVTSPSGATYINKSVATNNGVTVTSGSSKYYGYKGVFLQSEGDYLTFTASADFNMGTGDFCLETWIWPDNSQTTNPRLFGQTLNSSGNWDIYLEGSSGTSPIRMMGGAYDLGIAFPTNSTWHHFAIIRKSGVVQAFVNGIPSTKTISFAGNWGSSTDVFGISKIGNATNYNFNGYFNDMRLYKGISKYTVGNPFTPPNQIYLT